jgi:hypothetical protein
MTVTGWKPWEVDLLTMDDIADLQAHWTKYPPAHVAVCAAFGIGQKAKPKIPTLDELRMMAGE